MVTPGFCRRTYYAFVIPIVPDGTILLIIGHMGVTGLRCAKASMAQQAAISGG